MRLAERLAREGVGTHRLPLTPEGRMSLSCHPVEEMNIPEIERIIRSTVKGLIETESEDEICDLYKHMMRHPLAKECDFEPQFPAISGVGIMGYGPYLLAYEMKKLALEDSP